jgi:hypothetical protein
MGLRMGREREGVDALHVKVAALRGAMNFVRICMIVYVDIGIASHV